MTLEEINSEITHIEERMEWMYDNLEGCDWCCGGGDAEMEDLREDLDVLLLQRNQLEDQPTGG